MENKFFTCFVLKVIKSENSFGMYLFLFVNRGINLLAKSPWLRQKEIFFFYTVTEYYNNYSTFLFNFCFSNIIIK